MKLKPIKAQVLAVRIIPNADDALLKQWKIKPGYRSLGMITSSIDDIGYTALDEATKRAEVEVVYARSFYAGASHASGPLSGEFIGILAGPTPDEVSSGIDAVRHAIDCEAHFEALNEEGSHALYAHVVARTGCYLSHLAGIREGEPLAYLVAPPLEAMYGLDAALKAADVRLVTFFGPPSETNYGGGLLTGSQSACQAAADAFRNHIIELARSPIAYR